MVAPARFRTAQWLKKAGFAPQVFLFRNLESGQVIYSQVPVFNQHQIDALFQRPDWANKKPSTRRDIWRCMAVVDLRSYEEGVHVYQNLCRLRYLRDVTQVKKADALRKKNEDGHVWYSAQYRPTYTQEAVADLREALSKAGVAQGQIHWEDRWRMGDVEKHWSPVLPQLQHSVISRLGNSAREQSVIMRELGERAKQEFAKLRERENAARELSV
ncbi:mitochondrial 54S ribosomal protein mL67 [Lachancea thermotolerans CBS 6340]|uniref:Large ribosomal subunit protein mL67 n=1 Tax=Lachancea thermotolerans (strain ATCC 56472 / CBS 6340 / NRRL Y-8284) TaxID=559295 RepID=C5DM55_LACTC|nr:KLTH0G06116p [Lachancea thermotolerans CBS 6340]CAR24866.1 KLTH0G06116p [Lachancea thermotolerans CBS 6340]